MNTISALMRRTLGRALHSLSTAFVFAAFLACTAVLLALNLTDAEGTPRLFSEIWATSVAPFLPVLAAFLAMDVWSEERRTGRIDLLLSLSVRERDLALGKFFGVFVLLGVAIVLSFVAAVSTLALLAPTALAGGELTSALLAFFILLLQGGLWVALTEAVSAAFVRGAVSACVSLILTVALPRGLWSALLAASPAGRTAFGEMPLDAQVVDFCSGFVSLATVAAYLAFTGAALFVASKIVCGTRLRGRGSRLRRLSFLFVIVLALGCGVSFTLLARQLDTVVELPVARKVSLSPRLKQMLAESSGSVTLTAFLSRRDAAFRPLAHFLRLVRDEAQSVGGLRVNLAYVDPRWDLGPAGRLVRMGVQEGSLVIERTLRHVDVAVADGFDERAFTVAFQNILLPPIRRDVYWTTGHGESSFSDYGSWGMSDIARELSRAGYRNQELDLTGEKALPTEGALLVVAGAKTSFSRAELGRIDAYLKSGGRLLTLMSPPGEGGLASILPSWGIRPTVLPRTDVRTLSGTDAIVSDFADHVISQPLAGMRVVLERPLAFTGSAVAKAGGLADAIGFTPLARIGSSPVAVVAERGASVGADVAVRPMRLIAIGDASFVQNGQLAARANANRDFFLNAVAYLAGSEIAGTSDRPERNLLVTGFDRAGRVRFLVFAGAVIPCVVLVLVAGIALRRRWCA